LGFAPTSPTDLNLNLLLCIRNIYLELGSKLVLSIVGRGSVRLRAEWTERGGFCFGILDKRFVTDSNLFEKNGNVKFNFLLGI
jgi:hypothetical protein